MFSYVAATWNANCPDESHAADLIDERMRSDGGKWDCALTLPGLKVYCRGARQGASDVYSLGCAGVILGTVFTRIDISAGASCKATLGPAEAARIVRTRGRSLTEDYWGRYVAFLSLPEDSSLLVLRSPTGELDCLTTEIRGVRIYFSSARQCPPLAMRRFSTNWDYIAADLATLVPDTPQTGLVEIERILRGQCLQVSAGRTTRCHYWHPFSFVSDTPIEDATLAAAELRKITGACVAAWASCYRSIIPMLSGGLDSSVVVGLLHGSQSQARVVCLNYRNQFDPMSDERHYARLVAERAGYPLIEHEQSATFPLELILDVPRDVSPCTNLLGMGDVPIMTQLARSCGAQAWFLGHGGDEVFFKSAGRYNCVDFAHRYGLRPRLLSVALAGARMSDRALWPTLFEGVRDGLRRNGRAGVLKEYETLFPLLQPDVIESVRRKRLFVPAWFHEDDRIPPGKYFQILCLSVTDAMQRFCAPDDDPEFVSPLKSQPLQEFCLRAPTHILAHGNRARGLAHVAFARDLPPQIVRRRSKGGVLDYFKALWATNRSFVSELLIDGMLVRQNIVDKAKLEKTIACSFQGDFSNVPRLVALACTEAWVRDWQTAPQSAAA